jgi:hypothetical protein
MKPSALIIICFLQFACGQHKIKYNSSELVSPINLSHALSLVDSIKINNKSITFIWIYADAPSYTPIPSSGEGITCVDDVGRFMEVLETEILLYNNQEMIHIARGMTEFLLYMSRDDGLWHNFMKEDGSINTSHQNSVADFGWWAVRGLRGLAAAYNIFSQDQKNDELLSEIKDRIETADAHIQTAIQRYPERQLTSLGMRPLWLIKNAPDMSSELLMVLTKLHNSGDFNYYDSIEKLSKGLIEYQIQNENDTLNGMYFCWGNTWHNWGNNQANGLIEAYEVTADSSILSSVQLWANSFVPFVIENNFPWEISVSSTNHYEMVSVPQIAYGLGSIYKGLKSLSVVNENDSYKQLSEDVFKWFKGNNIAQMVMYDNETGRCFDGIDGPSKINRNSGAESTIECLLAIQSRKGWNN